MSKKQKPASNGVWVEPLGARVLVKRDDAEKVSKGGIVIPENAQEKPKQATVVEVGEGKVLDDGSVRKMRIKKGDVVLLSTWAGTEIKMEGEDYIITSEDEVLAVVHGQ